VKVAIFHPSARAAIRLFPEDVRREFGKAIFDLQQGRNLVDASFTRNVVDCAGCRGVENP
jgi:phage-related protein